MPLEQDKQGGFKFAIAEELRTGVSADIFSRASTLWAEAENVRFTQYGVRKLEGWQQAYDTTNGEPIRGLLPRNEAGSKIVYLGDLTKLYRADIDTATGDELGTGYSLADDSGGAVWDSGTSTWDSGTTIFDEGLVDADHWSFVDYGEFVLATNGRDAPQIRKGVGNFVSMAQGVTGLFVSTAGTGYVVGDTLTLTGGTGTGATAEVLEIDGSGGVVRAGMTSGGIGYTTAPTGFTGGTGTSAVFTFTVSDLDVATIKIFTKRGPHILGFNTSASAREFVWCDADDPDTWVTASTNLAGALEIRELESQINAVAPLGQRLAVYGTNQMFLVNYLGNELVFGYQPALSGIGAVSPRAVVAVGPRNYGLSKQGFFVTDGATSQYIDRPIRSWFEANAAAGQLSKAIAVHDEEHQQIRWYFPTTDVRVTAGVIFNYELGAWSFVTGDRSAAIDRGPLPAMVTGTETGLILSENSGENAGGSAVVATLATKPMDLSNADMVKELSSLRVGREGTGLSYRVGWSETEGGAVTYSAWTPIQTGFEFQNLRTAGRWLTIGLQSTGLNASWELMALEVIGRVEGTR